MEKRSSQKTPFSVIIVFKELQRNQFQDWCTRATVTYIVAFQWRGVQVEPRPGWETGEFKCPPKCAENARKRTTSQDYLKQHCSKIDICDHAVVSRFHEQQTKSHNIFSFFFQTGNWALQICVTIETHAARFQAKTLAKTYTRAVSAKYTQNYTAATLKKRVRKRWLAWSIVRKWNFVDTKRKSLIRLWQIKTQFNLYKTFFLT